MIIVLCDVDGTLLTVLYDVVLYCVGALHSRVRDQGLRARVHQP